jgi:hypothetical protein
MLLKKVRDGPANGKQQRSDGFVEAECTEQSKNACFYMHWGMATGRIKTQATTAWAHIVSRNGVSCFRLSDIPGPLTPFVQ